MPKRISLLLFVAVISLGIVAPCLAGHWSLAFWRSLNKEENSSNLFVRIWTFDENGNVVGNVPITTVEGVLVATTEANGRVDFPLDVNNEYRLKVLRGADSSDISPYMSNGRFPEWGHYSYELGFMYKSNINNPGTFDTSIVGGAVPRKGGTSYNSPVTASLAYHSFNPSDWDSDVGCRVLPSGGWGEHGQTFVANGNRVVAAQFHPTVSGVNVPISFTVEIRAGGPNGPVIASKTSNVHYNQDWWVVPFGTSACPVTPGQTYFARVYTSGGFNAYYMNTDFYPNGLANGQAYWRANSSSTWAPAQYPDLKGFIVCANVEATVSVTNVAVTPTASGATITWNTNVPASSRVDYGLTSGYGKTVTDATLKTSHTIILSKLRADTVYNFKVTSSAPDMVDGVSSNTQFITQSAAPNLLINGGFESGSLSPWVKFGSFSNNAKEPYGSQGIGPWCTGKCPVEGSYDFVSIASYGTKNGGAYQRVLGVTPGATYTARMRYYTWQMGGVDNDCSNVLGIDPYGGTNPEAPTVIKTPDLSSQDTWTFASISAVAQSPAMTIFLAAKQRWALQWNHNGFDDVRLTGPSAETSTKGNIPTIKNAVDGAAVILLGKVVSASAAQIGAYYVQEPNRQNGIRVEAISGSADVGELVNVSGWMATVDGERVIFDATLTPAGSGSVEPLAMINKAGGGSDFNDKAKGVTGGVGLNNVGLLITTFGKVLSKGANEFYITDGSTASLRVKAPAGVTLPDVNDFVSVTGICRLQKSGADYLPFVELRQPGDWRKVN